MNPSEPPFRKVQFYLTSSYPCSYLPGREARSQVATPAHLIQPPVYGELIRAGFRRSGQFTYRPQCSGCQACVPVRVDVARFTANRSQRRCARTNQDLAAAVLPLGFDPAHFALYRDYQRTRHPGGGMDQDGINHYADFLLASHVDTSLVAFNLGSKLVMVSVIDRVADGLSAVYCFFDTQLEARGLGTYNVLWQIRLASELGYPYVYLGYWIAASRKMAYKTNYQPLEALIEGQWIPLEKSASSV
jgi:arginine-tRNA-protein transferase